MKLRNYLLLGCICFCTQAFSQKKQESLPRPKLVVGLVIDQMRWDYLYRYYERYNNDGFKRLLNEGFSYENTYIPYIPTYTAIGHSTIYTGSVPAIHGIAGNEWIEQSNGYKMYCTEDSSVESVGTSSSAGKMSPRNLLVTTVTDELKLATNFRSKVIGVALKDRGGILPAGHSANAAYWFDDLTGNWISSTYYMKALPQWVQEHNNLRLPEKYLKKWETLYPIDTYLQSSKDNSPNYEGKYKGEEAPVFPHDMPNFRGSSWGTFRSTPFANTLTLDFAKAIVQNEAMGKDEITDFLAVSISSTDYLGHQFGPNSIEIEDTYLRLDKDLGEFLRYLDKTVGKGEYTIFLSADHGAAHNPSFLQDNNIPAGFWSGSNGPKNDLKEINSLLDKKYKADKIIRGVSNYQVSFNYPLIEEKGLDLTAIKKDVINYYKKQAGVAYVVDVKNIANEPIPEIIKTKIINGFYEKRSGEIQIILEPGWYQASGKINPGTTHGTWNAYDTHIPFVLSGWGIKQGKSNKTYYMTDIAATLAALLRIQEPNGNIGNAASEALK
ncbi:alkaline phosphatase PafA [Desertivirga xinjiangensis]|uniref:alkaline phosphatase PafA n=1 Tax=Desertivirga xinjiangensis TaxID=539206 RepID=UPI00210A6070|nr:alkaline phosphatase PafA [Pedobacter xinjiangensis]